MSHLFHNRRFSVSEIFLAAMVIIDSLNIYIQRPYLSVCIHTNA